MDLFDFLPAPTTARTSDWVPEAPPALDNVSEVFLNFETTGLRWWEGDKPVSCSLRTTDGRSWYLPWGHRGGGNLDEETCRRWAQRELRGKLITNINTRFDVHMGRVWGVDLEAQGNRVSDVSHYAALLDDHRKRMSLDVLAQEFFGGIEVARLDESRMAEFHAGDAAPRALYNVELVHRLKTAMWPELDKQDLQRVRALEDRVIFVVCEMEKNGTKIDVELLERWDREAERQIHANLMTLAKMAGFQVNPDSPKDLKRFFEKFDLPMSHTPKGGLSFTDAVLKEIHHPAVQLLRRTGKLIDLRVKSLTKYRKAIGSDGILRYALHQLRATKETEGHGDGGEAGTITGRFSSSELVKGVGINIQQVPKVSKQRTTAGFDEDDASHDDELFIIRQLHVPRESNTTWVSADAMQIEYRLFASYADNPAIIERYRQNPLASFHKETHAMIQAVKPDQTYKQQKDYNFATIYGAGLIKRAVMLGFISAEKGEELRRMKAYNHPLLAPVKAIAKVYDRLIPEGKTLLELASHLARPECGDYCKPYDALHKKHKHRGYVTDLLGRRSRFPYADRIHKALNSIIQGGAATINKQKLVELHDARAETNLLMLFTVHDEVDGETNDPQCAEKVRAILDSQSFPELKVPILWDVATGANWKECA